MDEATALSEATDLLRLTDVAPLKQGGQKCVYRAKRAGQSVVLKIVLLDGAADPNTLERCEREVALLKSLNSHNIVQVLTPMNTIGSPPTTAIWLEEYLDGHDFSDLAGSQWSWEDTAALLLGVGRGLAIMHDNGYIHRDLSASNVRRTSAKVWKVMDPGFAKHLNRTPITGLWQPGTPGYMSPEHALAGGRVTAASDVFCLGILGYKALVGELPINVGSDMDLYRRTLIGTQTPSVATARPDLRSDQAIVIDTCLQLQSARRYLDAGEIVDTIQRLGHVGGQR